MMKRQEGVVVGKCNALGDVFDVVTIEKRVRRVTRSAKSPEQLIGPEETDSITIYVPLMDDKGGGIGIGQRIDSCVTNEIMQCVSTGADHCRSEDFLKSARFFCTIKVLWNTFWGIREPAPWD